MTAIAVNHRSTFLRRVLLVDAATCLAMGLLLVLSSGVLAPLLGLPGPLLQYSGLSLVPIAAFIVWIAAGASPWPTGVWLVITGNALWVAGSAVLLVSGWVAPTLLGYAFVIAQAATVVLLTELEYLGLCKASA